MQVPGVQLEAFERMVYTRDNTPESNEKVARELFNVLGTIRRGSGFIGASEEQQPMCYTRLASAITALFADPRFGISWEGFTRLMCEHTQLHAIFKASAFETMDHLVSVIGIRREGSPDQMDFSGDQAIAKLLICWSLDSDLEINFEAMALANPKAAAAALIGILGLGGSHTAKSYERRLKLMGHKHLIAEMPLPETLIQSAADFYMHCSYVDIPDKHEVKRIINRKMIEVVAPLKIQEVSKAMVRKSRPTIVVPVEWFGSYHAMYRCYAPSMRQLKARFRLVAVLRCSTEQPSIDEKAKEIFDKVVELPEQVASISAFVEAIQREEPDIIYYPSIGMAAWFVALSNFRLAPIQVMTPGHPATSMSEKIDYLLSEGDLFGDEKHYIEKCVHLPVGSVRYMDREPVALPSRDGVLSRTTIRIAVPAMATKIIPPFLKVCQRIKAESKQPVEFHFFPNMTGLSHTLITKNLRQWLPGCTVHQRCHYQPYLENLARCNFMLSTFPFGGTNSVIDCFILGVPVVTMEGDQIHSRSDASMIRRVGLPEWLIAHSEDEFVAAALRCCDGESPKPQKDAAKEFFGPAPEGLEGKFLEAFDKIYEENIIANEARAAA